MNHDVCQWTVWKHAMNIWLEEASARLGWRGCLDRFHTNLPLLPVHLRSCEPLGSNSLRTFAPLFLKINKANLSLSLSLQVLDSEPKPHDFAFWLCVFPLRLSHWSCFSCQICNWQPWQIDDLVSFAGGSKPGQQLLTLMDHMLSQHD
jgi:hypothetical protein